MCKTVDELAPSMSYCLEHKYKTNMTIEETLESFDKIIGEPPKVLEEYKNKECFVCGQPWNKSPQVIELKDFIRTALTTQREQLLDTPIGVDEWANMGKKWGYWDYFKEKEREIN